MGIQDGVFKYDKSELTFKFLLENLKDSIKGWDYFVNWSKVKENVKDIENIVKFVEKSKLIEIFRDKTIKNLVDYVFGVEVGLDSNGRKNRSGTAVMQ